MTIHLTQDLEFVAPADIGATYTARCSVVAALAEDRFRVATKVSSEDDVLIQGTATILIDELPE